jgi:hypothetical protein
MKFKFSTCVLLIACSISANASLIKFEFSGTFNRSVALLSSVTKDANVGEQFSGSFSFDAEEPLFSIITPETRSRYSTGQISASTGNFNYLANQRPQLQIFNNWEFTSGGTAIDDVFLSAYQNDFLGSGFYLLQINMRDYTTNLLDNLSIPDAVKIEALMENGQFFLRRFSSINQEEWWADGDISVAKAVAAPSAVIIFAIGFLGLAACRLNK